MNIFDAQGVLNPTNLLLLGGLALLLLNIGYGLFRTSHNDVAAGRLTVVAVLLACSLVIVGSVQVASANSAAATSSRVQRAGAPAQVAPAQSVVTAVPSDTSATSAVSAAGSTDASATPAATAAGTATKRTRSGTPGAAANSGVVSTPAAGSSSAVGRSSAANAGNAAPAAGHSAANTTNNATSTTDNSAATLILILAVLGVVLSAILYLIERRYPTFNQANSRGLLNLGGAVFILIALQIIPMIPAQFSSVNTASAASARTASFPTRSVITATPTATEMPTKTPTLIPTFTPTPTTVPQLQPTEIAYVNTQPMATAAGAQSAAINPATSCTVTATNNLNLRSDPSTTHPLLLTIPAGTTLSVSGISPDKAWWKISYNSGISTQVGWVSAQYTTNNGKCSTVPTLQQ